MGFNKETKLGIVKTYAGAVLQKKDKPKFDKLDDKTIRCLEKKLETDFNLAKNTPTESPKSALSDRNITRE